MAQIINIRHYYCYYLVKFASIVNIREYPGSQRTVLAWSHGPELPVSRIVTINNNNNNNNNKVFIYRGYRYIEAQMCKNQD